MARILIMEDDEDQAFLLSEFLSGEGHTVSTSASGQEALDKLEDEKPDLLITDVFVRKGGTMVPDGGLLLISRVRFPGNTAERAWMRKLPIIAITGGASYPGQANLLTTLEDMGANRSFRKPIDLKELGSAVRELLHS